MTFYILLFLLLFFTLLSGFLATSLVSLFSLSSSDLKGYASDTKKSRVVKLLSNPHDLLVTLVFCDICANILIQNTAANLFGDYSSWLFKVGVPLIIIVFFGEILPKTLALPFNTQIAYRIAPIIFFLQKILGPLRHFITAITTRISRTLFFFLKQNKETSKEEMHYLLKSSKEAGILDHDEVQWISGYLATGTHPIKERMHPRDEILYYNIDEPISKLQSYFKEKAHSRIPVCRGELQNVLGILACHDYLTHRHTIVLGEDLLPLLKKPFYAPETTLSRALLHRFLQDDESMALVVNEYGLISGLLTVEDLYEMVIGKIADRRVESSRYSKPSNDVLIASGKLELSEFESLMGSSLPSENNMVTLGGWLTEQLGEIPKCGTTYTWKNYLFQILASDPNRILRAYIRRLK